MQKKTGKKHAKKSLPGEPGRLGLTVLLLRRVLFLCEVRRATRKLRRVSPSPYLSKASTVCEDWLACANIAVAACAMICERARDVVSTA